MIKNLDELMMKMCNCKNDCIGVEVDGVISLYEDFGDGDPVERIYKHFGTDKQMTFYSVTWAHQRRIKELMDVYKGINDKHGKRAIGMAKHIANYIVRWSGCTYIKALEQVQNLQVSYLSIA